MSADLNWARADIPFVPGLQLAEDFYRQAVSPLLERHYPRLAYAAGLLGDGSDVLGYDTPMSRDHHWGPRLLLFLSEQDHAALAEELFETLRRELPLEFAGYPVHFSPPNAEGTRWMQPAQASPIDPLIPVHTLRSFGLQQLGFDLNQTPDPLDWLTFPEQRLLHVTAGRIFHDEVGLQAARDRLAYYPDGVWRYLLASQWARIAQEEHFVGRAGENGDDTGSRLIAARLVGDCMRLAFLIERRYAPYAKWFGTAFRQLWLSTRIGEALEQALAADDWQTREAALARAYQTLAEFYNRLRLHETVDPQPRQFHDRPFTVLFAGRFAEAARAAIPDAQLRSLPLYGSVSQFASSTDVLEDPQACRRLRALYEAAPWQAEGMSGPAERPV